MTSGEEKRGAADRAYLQRRFREALQQAAEADDPRVKNTHMDFARRYKAELDAAGLHSEQVARRERARSVNKRQAMIAAARAALIERGLAGLNMDQVALSAGVSKVTIYGHFQNKSGLVRAVVASTWPDQAWVEPDPAVPIAIALRLIGDRIGALWHDPVIRRLCNGDLASCLPEGWPEMGPMRQAVDALIDRLGQAAAKGELQIPDVRLAADQLLSLWKGAGALEGSPAFEVDPEKRITAAVDLFLANYRKQHA